MAIALFSGVVVGLDYAYAPRWILTDIDQVWFAAQAVLNGLDPYPLIGPGREFDGPWPLYYPLMAPISILPIGYLPAVGARVLVAAIPSGLLAFLLTRDGYRFLPVFGSGAFLASIKLVQWPPLLACALFLPWLGFFAAAKPNLGLAILAGSRTLRDSIIVVSAIAAITLIAFVIPPGWYTEWRAAVESAPHFRSYMLVPGGQILLLSLLRWRLPEGRLFAALAIVPQTPSLTTVLLLLFIPSTRRDVTILALLTYIPFFFVQGSKAFGSFNEWVDVMGWALLLTAYLPALYFLLRKPNVGPVPEFIERAVHTLPAWIRGSASPRAISFPS
ncbi:MAG: hypothetical protein IPP90_16380 [Gemmatimonadaceae bacterium]|nr:hypothetical protein [Gemmatimonadaceae bacterium]